MRNDRPGILSRLLAGAWEIRTRIFLVVTIVAITITLGYGVYRRAARINLHSHVVTRQ